MAQNLRLTSREVDAIARIAQAEFGAAANRISDDADKSSALYNGLRGVVDTVLNRVAEGQSYGGDTVEGVISAKRQFEPIARYGGLDNLPAAREAVKAIVAERLAEVAAGAPTRPFTFFDNPKTVEERAGVEASKETVDRSRLGLLDPTGQFVSDPSGSHNYYSKPNFRAPRGFDVSLDDDAQGTVKDWSTAYSGFGLGNLNDTPSELGALARLPPAALSAGMSFTPPLPGAMPDVAGPLTPGYNFSNLFGMGLPDPLAGAQNLFSPVKDYERQPMPQVSPDSMRQFLQDTPPNPGLREIPAAPRAAPPWSWPQAQTYDPLSSIGTMLPSAPPASGIPDYGPDWGTPGPGLPAVSTPDYTTGSDGTFQTTAPSTMAPKTTTADPVGAPAASVVPQFTKMVPSYAAVAAAVAAADEKAAKDAASEMDRETARAKALSGLPQDTATASLALPAKPPAAAPPAKPVQKPRLPPLPPPQVVRTVPQPKEAPKDPGTALKDQFGTPQQFMGSGVSAQDFAKGVAAVAAINGNDKAKAYAGQLTSERPGISGVAFDALQNEFAKATSQPQTKGLLGAFGLGVPSQPALGASNSPSPTQGMYVQGPNGAPTWANYSTDQQNALNNSSGFWGGVQNFFGFGAGANNGWGPSGSMGFGPGTSGLY